MDHRMKHVRELFEKLCPGEMFLPQVGKADCEGLDDYQTHSSQEAEKEDSITQELSLFDQLMENLEKEEQSLNASFLF